jgi:RNA polymerase sigma-70 factor, ECF subfamily
MANATLEGLSAEQRTVITMREIDGWSYQQIASAISIPVGTVRSRAIPTRA